MSQLARRVPDRTEIPRPLPAADREGASGTRAPAHAVGNGTAGSLIGRDGPSDELLALQRTAGNRAVARLMGRGVVQRHPGPTTNAEVEDGSATEGPVEAGAAPANAEAADGSGTEGPVEESAAPTKAEATSQPGTGTTGTTGSTGTALTGAARRTAIEGVLAASDTGRWAQGIITRWRIPVDYEYGGQGSYHQGGNIYINRTLGVGAAAITVMHEAQHADTYYSGRGADRTTLSRADYITRSIADEAEAVVRQIEGLAVTTGLGVDMAGNPITEALKQRYLRAFYAKRDELQRTNPGMSRAEINAICRTTSRDGEVTMWFYDGTFVTSTNNNSYAVFYGNQWDEVHRTPART
jgi:hypothetical protein